MIGKCKGRPLRAGTAVIELVMIFPLFLVVVVLLLYVGALMAGQSEAIVKSRHDAWKRRTDTEDLAPFDFGVTNQGRIETSVGKALDISPVLSGFPAPRADHFVFGGAWDYRTLGGGGRYDLNRRANLEVYGRLLELAGKQTGGNARAMLSDFSDISGQIQAGVAKYMQSRFGGNLASIGKMEGRIRTEQTKSDDRNRRVKEAQRAEAQQEIAVLDHEIAGIDSKIVRSRKATQDILGRLRRAATPQNSQDELTDEEKNRLSQLREHILREEIPRLERQRDARIAERRGWEKALRTD